ncbi:hypothetical protein [Marivirga sp.]|uniref:hypothetical protein n=1 Tax=Marivirga sp. TaxID=2018662 RepID=UPI002D80201B|nr:hypothetical protein [Marivirga sp.]HET8860547.1 hypothetical protein [Marivirga sp.]
MKRFLIYILSILLLLIFLNWLVLKLNHPRKNYKQKVEKNSLYILGDSHALGFNPKYKEDDKTYNLSYGSDNLIDFKRKFDYLIEKEYLQRGDTLVLEVDLQVFSKYRLTSNNNDISGIYTNDFASIKNYYFPILGEVKVLNRKFLKTLISKKSEKKHNDLIKLNSKTDSIRIKNRYKLQFGKDFKLESEFLSILEEIVNQSQNKGIHIVAIHYPLHPYYLELLKEDHDINEMKGKIEKITSPFKFHDYSYRIQKDKYFKNQDHLNSEGKIVLREIFIQEITLDD